MAIPKDILKIPRPSSTRVKATSKEGIYNVIQRTSIRKMKKLFLLKKEWLERLLMVFFKA